MSEPKKSGSIGKTAKEYSQSTTIHGFAYIGEDGPGVRSFGNLDVTKLVLSD